MNEKNYTKEDAYKTLGMINDWISRADTKTSILMGFISLLVGFTIKVFDGVNYISQSDKVDFVVVVVAILTAMYIILAILAIMFSCMSLMARINLKKYTKKQGINLKSAFYFNSIVQMGYKDFINETSNKSEELLAQFSTRIYSTDSARQKNLEITSKTLNGTVVKPNETFSFTKTVGPSTPSKGYEEADIYDSNGNKIKGYGGGNCQISSTLYNAVQKVSSLKVVERHEHSNTVPYVKEGHDAAVAYGSVDFKFKNTNNFSIKILVETSKTYVVVKLMKF